MRQTNPNKGNRVNEEAACLDDKSHRKQLGGVKVQWCTASSRETAENYRRLKTSSYLRCLQVKSFVFIQQLIMKENLETPSTLISPTHGSVMEPLPIRSLNADYSLLIRRIRIGLVETVVRKL